MGMQILDLFLDLESEIQGEALNLCLNKPFSDSQWSQSLSTTIFSGLTILSLELTTQAESRTPNLTATESESQVHKPPQVKDACIKVGEAHWIPGWTI